MKAVRVLLVCLLATAAVGCARQAPVTATATGTAAAAHAARVGAVQEWDLGARIAVQRDEQGFSAELRWRQRGAAFDLRVMAPLSGGTYTLTGDPGGVVLLTPKGERFSAADPEVLMRQHLGWSIALGGARYWVRGLPRPQAALDQPLLDPAGRYTDFAQDGWRISILEYMEDAGMAVPRRLYMANDSLQVRLAVTRWAALPSGAAAAAPR